VRRTTQCVCLALFLWLFFYVSWPYAQAFSSRVLPDKAWAPPELFLWLDPLVGLSAALAARAWNVALIGTAAVVLLSLLFPRGFCGYLCPLGTLVDACDFAVGQRVRQFHVQLSGHWSCLRYYVLAAVLVSALCGVLLSGFVAAIPVVTRGLLFTGGRLELGTLKHWSMLHPAGVEVWLSVALFASIFALSFLGRRFWCRHLCPSGALLSLFSAVRLFQREVSGECTRCGQCVKHCAFDAIDDDFETRRPECASCQTCAGVCPAQAISFTQCGRGRDARATAGETPAVQSRRAFLASSVGGAAIAAVVRAVPAVQPALLRPPGSVAEKAFLGLCVRCGQCLQVCPGQVLRAAGFESGMDALWTPVAVPAHAGCHQDCNFCGQVCPTGAIRPLPIEEKRRTHMGLAVIDPNLCLPHHGDRDCQLCFDECNAAGYRAIEMRRIELPAGQMPEGAFSPAEIEEMTSIAAPFVNAAACVGCGLCEYRCHSANTRQHKLLPRSAVVIVAENAERPAARPGQQWRLKST
jgi:MauM/NapG family ferredoxin protein